MATWLMRNLKAQKVSTKAILDILAHFIATEPPFKPITIHKTLKNRTSLTILVLPVVLVGTCC